MELAKEKLLKVLNLLTSRKFIAAVAAILVVFKVIPEGEESAIVEAVLSVVTLLVYIGSVAYEDGNRYL